MVEGAHVQTSLSGRLLCRTAGSHRHPLPAPSLQFRNFVHLMHLNILGPIGTLGIGEETKNTALIKH